MSYTPEDPAAYKELQRERWDSVASGWSRWWGRMEDAAGELNQRLVELSGAREGHWVLDVATGLGEPALTAAHRVRESGRVVATDLSPAMLQFASRRARERGLDHIELRAADAETLDVGESRFDAALCRWGLMLMANPVAAAERIRIALKPGARLAASVWGPSEEAPFFRLPAAVLAREFGLPSPGPPTLESEPGPLRLGSEALFREVLERAGFHDIAIETFPVTLRLGSLEEFRAFLGDMSSRLRAILSDQDDASRERFWSSLAEELAPYTDANGEIRLTNSNFCASAHAPE